MNHNSNSKTLEDSSTDRLDKDTYFTKKMLKVDFKESDFEIRTIQGTIYKILADYEIGFRVEDKDVKKHLHNLVEALHDLITKASTLRAIEELEAAKAFNRKIDGKVLYPLLETYFDDRINQLKGKQ